MNSKRFDDFARALRELCESHGVSLYSDHDMAVIAAAPWSNGVLGCEANLLDRCSTTKEELIVAKAVHKHVAALAHMSALSASRATDQP
jgi:hypothetical protein